MQESPIPLLTKGEWNCLLGVSRLLDSHQIAEATGYTKGTVDAYIASGTRKLSANNRKHAVQVLRRDYPHLFDKVELDFPPVAPAQRGLVNGILQRLPWPWPTLENPTNDRSVAEKIVGLVIATSLLLAAAAAYLALVIQIGGKR